ncbi:biotin-independent malonate decarboxylase subunit beta [Herbaspirillum huttiense]|jgi:malonate decarboxylase beta subunit|uniref:Biotin-independent malonate decarboxylase subunit beta n=2 Tax=Herbaspirillum huttiense TaxID=863372 RepID=A0AAJ2H9S7_9BURK|nr:biotin-independent malonate decarboxylase subunit beta [Herbaspirillum huttiense]MDR9836526.1 biotin-independent malonate decarboxylase subunit beta [Herbaspirillum huttiense]UWE14384.1 biotin-independent malonate decarboxylase subunit beta [Herbaspirillum huttiense]
MSASYLEATARERILAVLDAGSFKELLPPAQRVVSPHLGQLDAPVSFDDGVIIGEGLLGGRAVMAAAQEGGFMGGAVGEVHGAKLVGLLKRAMARQAAGVILLLETGGVRLHEANAGLIAVSEVMRAVLEARAAGIPVIVLVGGANGCFGGMGIVARCANTIIMSEEGRLAMSGPEVIETANGVEEFDSRDRALVWRTTGGKHRYLIGDCQQLVSDDIDTFRTAAIAALSAVSDAKLTLAGLEAEQEMLRRRIATFGHAEDPMDIWAELGVARPETVPMLEAAAFTAMAERLRIVSKA